MTSIQRMLGLSSFMISFGLLVLAAVLWSRPVDASGMLAARPSSVVTVNLPILLEKLNERAQAQSELSGMIETVTAEDERRQTAIKTLREQLGNMPKAGPSRQEINEQLTLAVLEYNGWYEFATEQLDIEKSLLMRDLDIKIKAAIQEMSDANGYDIVLNDDSTRPLSVNTESRAPRELQVKQQMVDRRMLYAAPTVDVTEELIQRMNNAFNTGS